MKIIVEPGDQCCPLPPGEYEVHPTQCNMSYEIERWTDPNGRSRQMAPSRTMIELSAYLAGGCKICGNHSNHTADCPKYIAEKLIEQGAAALCAECHGSGVYTSPLTGKQSRCSRGC